jgi:energy-coupling factor transporter ATP-binding protein EcfA2
MITKIKITDNKAVPGGLEYLSTLPAFANGKEYNFKPGINLIVGANGSGKSTLLKILKTYLLVREQDSSWERDATGWPPVIYPFRDRNSFKAQGELHPGYLGIDVYADYRLKTFAYAPEIRALSLYSLFQQSEIGHKSTGEKYMTASKCLFGYVFSKQTEKYFDYSKASEISERFPSFKIPDMGKYAKEHTVDCAKQWTFLLDEPDRNLDVENIFSEALDPFMFGRKDTQVIGVLHNPLLLVELSKRPDVNIIELTPGYMNIVKENVKKIAAGL